MVKTHSNFTFLWAKLILFLCSDLANFCGQSPFHSNDKFSCSKPIPFHFIPAELSIDYSRLATPSCLYLRCFSTVRALAGNSYQRQHFTDGLGLSGKLAEYSSKSSTPPVPGILSVRSESVARELCISPITTRCPVQQAASFLLLPDALCDQLMH